jgi:beta-lactamase superfamily II metal-dependent hydrolase
MTLDTAYANELPTATSGPDQGTWISALTFDADSDALVTRENVPAISVYTPDFGLKATLTVPGSAWMQSGGRSGRHSESAVIDALRGSGVRNIDMPLLPDRVYEAITQRHDVSGAPPIKTDD